MKIKYKCHWEVLCGHDITKNLWSEGIINEM